jgi:nitrilase
VNPFRVAAVQMLSTADVPANLAAARRLLGQAASAGATLAVLPEAFACADAVAARALGAAERSADGPLRRFLADAAREFRIAVVGGTIPIAAPDGRRVRAACLLVGPDGCEIARYDKIHLFDSDLPDAVGTYRESDSVEPGDRIVTVDTPFARLGLAVCYDLRFPELFRVQAARGMELLVLPSAFTAHTGAAHWHVLLRARAIENQCWLVAPNHGGRASERRLNWGGSAIIDPWGRVVASAATGEAVLVAELEPRVLSSARAALPVEAHRRVPVPDPG